MTPDYFRQLTSETFPASETGALTDDPTEISDPTGCPPLVSGAPFASLDLSLPSAGSGIGSVPLVKLHCLIFRLQFGPLYKHGHRG